VPPAHLREEGGGDGVECITHLHVAPCVGRPLRARSRRAIGRLTAALSGNVDHVPSGGGAAAVTVAVAAGAKLALERRGSMPDKQQHRGDCVRRATTGGWTDAKDGKTANFAMLTPRAPPPVPPGS